MDSINKISHASVPGYGILEDYKWVNDYLRGQEIKQKIKSLREKKRETKKTNPSHVSMLAQARKDYEANCEKRIAKIMQFYKGRRGRGQARKADVFNHLKYHHNAETFPIMIDLEEVEEAISRLPDDGSSDDDYHKKLDRIDKELTELRAELEKLSPPIYFKMEDGRAVDDIREAFVDHWFWLQARLCGRCNPRGIVLGQSTPQEKNAWEKLGLGRVVREKTNNTPEPNPGFDGYSPGGTR